MLVLSRRTHERLILLVPGGLEIEIMVAGIRFDKVDLGITAPLEVKILKKETHLQDIARGHGSKINDKPRQRYQGN